MADIAEPAASEGGEVPSEGAWLRGMLSSVPKPGYPDTQVPAWTLADVEDVGRMEDVARRHLAEGRDLDASQLGVLLRFMRTQRALAARRLPENGGRASGQELQALQTWYLGAEAFIAAIKQKLGPDA
jgi:hypothetical protein